MPEDTRVHDPKNCDCGSCSPAASPQAAPDLCNCVEDAFRAGLEAWRENCTCCFTEAYPNGIQGAIALARR